MLQEKIATAVQYPAGMGLLKKTSKRKVSLNTWRKIIIMPFPGKGKNHTELNVNLSAPAVGSFLHSRIFPLEFPLVLAHCPSLGRKDFLLLLQ